jgi:hypothetical protein
VKSLDAIFAILSSRSSENTNLILSTIQFKSESSYSFVINVNWFHQPHHQPHHELVKVPKSNSTVELILNTVAEPSTVYSNPSLSSFNE